MRDEIRAHILNAIVTNQKLFDSVQASAKNRGISLSEALRELIDTLEEAI